MFNLNFCLLTANSIHVWATLKLTAQVHGVLFRSVFYFSIFLQSQYSCVVMMILSCGYYLLVATNSTLKKSIKNDCSIPTSTVIKTVSVIYDKLCETYELVSACFTAYIVIYFMDFVYFNVFTSYAVYVFIKSPTDQKALFLQISISWILHYSPCVFWVMIFSSRIQTQGSNMIVLIQKLAYKHRNDKEILKCIDNLSLMFEHRKPKISCGLFVINWQYCFSVFVSIFGFTIILAQFYDVQTV